MGRSDRNGCGQEKVRSSPKEGCCCRCKVSTDSIAPHKVASIMLSLTDAAAVSKVVGKRPRPPTKMTSDIAQTILWLKKKVRNRECENFVLSI